MNETIISPNLSDAIAATLQLVAEQMPSDPQWSVRQIEGILDNALVDWYRGAREAATGVERIDMAQRVLRSPLAGIDDHAALAHAFADRDQLENAILAMKHAAALEPRPEFFQFLASVFERNRQLPLAIEAVASGLRAKPDSEQLQTDEKRILAALRRAASSTPSCAMALWNYKGRRIGGGIRLAWNVIAWSVRETFKKDDR